MINGGFLCGYVKQDLLSAFSVIAAYTNSGWLFYYVIVPILERESYLAFWCINMQNGLDKRSGAANSNIVDSCYGKL